MKSRQNFEGTLSANVKARLLESRQSKEEALWLIDTFLSACFFLAGIIERGSGTERQMNCIFARAQRVREAIEKGKRNPPAGAGTDSGIDGDPIIIRP